LHRFAQQRVSPARGVALRSEEVGRAVVDRVDIGEVDETLDIDGARLLRRRCVEFVGVKIANSPPPRSTPLTMRA